MSRDLAILGADTATQQAGGTSFIDPTNLPAFTAGAVVSGLGSIYNTFVSAGNALGADMESLDVGQKLEEMDHGWYEYYKQNQELVDTAGFVATSFLPGTLAIKGLKAVQAGRGAGAIGRAVSGPLNFFNARRDEALRLGLQEIGSQGGTAAAYINANKLSAIGWGYAEQALQAAAFESAVAITMKQSPLLADKGTKDILNDIAFGTFAGGVFGGAIDNILVNRTFKDAVRKVAGIQRAYDTPGYFTNLGLGIGDEGFGFVDSYFSLPKTLRESDKLTDVKAALNGKEYTINLEKHLGNVIDSVHKDTLGNLQLTLQNLGPKDAPEIGQLWANLILKRVRDGETAGRDIADIKSDVGALIMGLKKSGPIPMDPRNFKDDSLFYLADQVDLKKFSFTDELANTKILDSGGKPMKVYHGTTADFPTYNATGDGIFFTNSPAMASRYASGEGGNVRPAFLNMKNPAPFEAQKAAGFSRSKLQEQGYDGFIEQIEGRKIYVVFDNSQVINAFSGPPVRITKVEDFMAMAKSRTPFEKNATARPYRTIGDPADARVVLTAPTFQAAWADGYDMAIIAGRMRINPKSKIFEQVTDPTLIPSRYVNMRTGNVSDDVIATWADKLPVGASAANFFTHDGVLDAARKGIDISPEAITTAEQATARHAFIGSRDPKYFANRTVDTSDISSLERLATLSRDELQTLNTTIRDADGGISQASDVNLKRLLVDHKLDRLQELYDAGMDPREISYMINAPETWMERAMSQGFTRTAEDNLERDMNRNLSEYTSRENVLATWASPRSFVDLGVVSKELLEATEKAATSKSAKYVDTFVTGQLGFFQRVETLLKIHNNAFYSVFGEEAKAFMDISIENVRKMADELGIGAGTFSFSNANYGDQLRVWSQYTGMKVHQLIQKVAGENLEKLQFHVDPLRNNRVAGAELGIITNMLRRSPHKFVFAIEEATGVERLAVRDVTKIDYGTGMRTIRQDKLDSWLADHATTGVGGRAEQAIFTVENKEAQDFLKTWVQVNGSRINKRAVIMNARGKTLGWDPDVVYAPPINTQKYPYFAFVKIKEGHLLADSDVGMITAKNAEELAKLTNTVDKEKFDVFFKENTERYFKVKNEYDAQLSLNEPRVNSMMNRTGKLNDFYYEVRPENVLEDFITYSQNADAALVRHSVETKYAQLFTELGALGKKYTEVATSQMSGASRFYDKTTVNPFGDYTRTALDISKRSSFPFISKLNEFVDSAGTTAYRILVANTEAAKNGTISWQQAEQIASKYGIGGAYTAENAEEAFSIANRPMDRNLIRETVSKANMFLSTVGLRLDFANSLVNVISLPIMLGQELSSLTSLAKKDPEAIGALRQIFSTTPDGKTLVPSFTKVIANAMHQVIGDMVPGGSRKLIQGYQAAGDVKNVMLQFYDMLGELAIKPKLGPKGWSEKVNAVIGNATEWGAKWTGNNFAEDFTRALSANVMDQLTAPLVTRKLLSPQEALAYRSIFVNRVNGNYVASQRPIAFQGTVGAAVSLFQTYMFNVMQQLVRHVENRDLKSLLVMGGLQGATYGLNGLPFFEAVNTHLIGNASINEGHKDIYSTVTQLAGKELGEWMLYGTASAFPLFSDKLPALYTRGDINPRHVSILPVSPADIPAVSVSTRIVQNLLDVGGKISNGGALGASLLEGLEHNGVSRPLAGFAQMAQGYTTTSKGSLVSASNDFDAVVGATRMLGARPMDEAVALNTMYRNNAYKSADLERLSKLGEAVKTKLRKNQMPDAEELQQFMKQYASAGGNLQHYSAALANWSKDANMSIVNQMKNFHDTSYAKRLSEIMSGVNLEDYTTPAAPVTPPAQ